MYADVGFGNDGGLMAHLKSLDGECREVYRVADIGLHRASGFVDGGLGIEIIPGIALAVDLEGHYCSLPDGEGYVILDGTSRHGQRHPYNQPYILRTNHHR